MINEFKIKEQICEIGRRVYAKGFAAANDGNISFRLNDREVMCSPTMVSKGFMKPEDICKVDYEGKQLAGTKKRTSEVLLHLAVYKNRADVQAVVHEPDGGLLMPGSFPVHDLPDLGLDDRSLPEEGEYTTVAGMVLAGLGFLAMLFLLLQYAISGWIV